MHRQHHRQASTKNREKGAARGNWKCELQVAVIAKNEEPAKFLPWETNVQEGTSRLGKYGTASKHPPWGGFTIEPLFSTCHY